MQAVILAAGRGKRLHPFTDQRSKAMLPILGKPIVCRIVEAIANNGVNDFIIVTSPGDKQLINYFQAKLALDINIQFVEQEKPKGMAHALLSAMDWITGDFFLSSCDSLIPSASYANLFSTWATKPQTAALLTLMIVPPEKVGQSAVVQIENQRITKIIEKPSPLQKVSNITSLPIYIFQPGIRENLQHTQRSSRGEYELQDAIQSLIDQKKIVRGVMIEERLNLTSAQDLLEINLRFLQIEQPHLIQGSVHIGNNVVLRPPYFIGPHTTIEDHCIIGPNVYIESDCQIDHHCQISDSLLLKGSKLVPGQILNMEITI